MPKQKVRTGISKESRKRLKNLHREINDLGEIVWRTCLPKDFSDYARYFRSLEFHTNPLKRKGLI